MPTPRVNRTLSKGEMDRIKRSLLRHAKTPEARAAIDRATPEVEEFLKDLIRRKYDAAYHSGYTQGQKNPQRMSS